MESPKRMLNAGGHFCLKRDHFFLKVLLMILRLIFVCICEDIDIRIICTYDWCLQQVTLLTCSNYLGTCLRSVPVMVFRLGA